MFFLLLFYSFGRGGGDDGSDDAVSGREERDRVSHSSSFLSM